MPDFAVSEGKIKQLRLKMTSLGVREEDILETFARSSGPGGQRCQQDLDICSSHTYPERNQRHGVSRAEPVSEPFSGKAKTA